jgi:hypothetical protein
MLKGRCAASCSAFNFCLVLRTEFPINFLITSISQLAHNGLEMSFTSSWYRRSLALILLISAVEFLPAAVQSNPAVEAIAATPSVRVTVDPREIVRRSVEADQRNTKLAKNYTYQERIVEKRLDNDGRLKKQEIKTYDISILYGEPYRRLLQRDDQPLNPEEAKKEEDKLNKFIAKHKNESPQDREKRLAEADKKRQDQRAFAREIVDAYNFSLLGEEKVDGRSVYVIEATPRPDFRPKQPHADLLSKFRGKMWIDKAEYQWVKMQAETIDTVSFGLFLFRLHKGSSIHFEQTRVNEEIWLPRHVSVAASARVALMMNTDIEQETTFSNYRKFVTDSRLLSGVEESQRK